MLLAAVESDFVNPPIPGPHPSVAPARRSPAQPQTRAMTPDSLPRCPKSRRHDSLASSADRRLFVSAPTCWMHDPHRLFRFEEHDIHLPMMGAGGMDRAKGVSEVARNVRQVSHLLDDLTAGASKDEIDRGLPYPARSTPGEPSSGRLCSRFAPPAWPPVTLPGNTRTTTFSAWR